MNERIKQLAMSVQCERHWTEEDIEKFAELIVRECANRCEQSPYPHPNYSVAIKKHFGVE